VNKANEGRRVVASLQKRIDYVVKRVSNQANNTVKSPKTKVVWIEWINPFYTAGHWIPQMITIAGGINGISSRGKPSCLQED